MVAQYLSASSNGAQAAIWIGDEGDHDFRLTRFQLIGGEGEVLRTDKPLTLEIEARLIRPILGLVVAVEVWTTREQRLAYSAHDDIMPPPAAPVRAGEHCWRLHIPAHTFASGSYEFRLHTGVHGVRNFVDGVRLTAMFENSHGIGRRFQSPATHLFRPDWRWESIAAPAGVRVVERPEPIFASA